MESCNVVSTIESVNENLKCDHSNLNRRGCDGIQVKK